ncbi:hypothetical protein [Spirosoma pulveris]
MHEDLAKIFDALKVGKSTGIDITPLFIGREDVEEDSFIDYIFNVAIAHGFAESANGFNSGNFGSGMFMKLTWEGKQYPTYQAFVDRHKKPDISTINITGSNNSGIVQGSNLRDLNAAYNTTTIIPAANDHKQNAIVSFMGTWVAPAVTSIFGGLVIYYWSDINNFFGLK